MKPPDRIYLQWHGDGDPDDGDDVSPDDVTWCPDRVHETDVEYVRVDAAGNAERALR
jgi:hypothetical protein